MSSSSVIVHSCERFVSRTTNWLYDYLTYIPGYRVIVVAAELSNRIEFPKLEAWNVDPASLKRRIWRQLGKRRLYPGDAWKLKRVSPQLLHSHFGDKAVNDYQLAKTIGRPWVVSFYGADIYQLPQLAEWRTDYGCLFTTCQSVLALGPKMKMELEKVGCPKNKIAVQPIGVDVDSLPNAVRSLKKGEVLKILFAGTFREKKGLQYVIEAAGLLNRTGVRFELHIVGDSTTKAGDQKTKESAFRSISQFGLESKIRHYSWLRFQELMHLALNSHVFVGPSVTASDGDSEGTPFVLQQMMATGMPCVATRHSDIPFLFGDLANLLVPERDSRAIAERLQTYFDDPQLLTTHGAALREQVRIHFDIRRCAVQLSELYGGLIQ